MLGAGVFVTTGRVARDTAGPAVFVSYVVAGVSALLSSFCYAEFAVRVPVAGGAFSYLRVTFGKLVRSQSRPVPNQSIMARFLSPLNRRFLYPTA
jgi:amino acid transporter